MKKVLSILLLFISFSTSVSAYDFMVDGLCYDIKDDSISVKVTYEKYYLSEDFFKDVSGEIVIPERVEHDGKSYLVTEIGGEAFAGCCGLTSIEIPNSVTSIGDMAFLCCTSLTSIETPNSVTSIDGDPFLGTAWYNNQPDGLIYAGMVAYKYKGKMPDGTSIVLKDGCTEIASFAFEGCSGLISIRIPNSLTEIGRYAFKGCSGLTSVIIPSSVTKIGYSAFEGCTGMTSVEIPNSVTTIDSKAFVGCTGLTSVTIPNLVTEIGSTAFNGCTGLTSVTIPNSVTSIGVWAFANCSGLTSVTIPNSVTSIGAWAFANCSGLTSVEIPNLVTEIGSSAFAGCTGLTSIVSEIEKPQLVVYGTESWRKNAAATIFSGVDFANCILNIPEGTRILYERTSPWLSFVNKLEYVDSIPNNNQIITEDKIKHNLQQYYENRYYNGVIQLGEQLFQTPDFTANPENADLIEQIAESYYFMQLYMKAKKKKI